MSYVLAPLTFVMLGVLWIGSKLGFTRQILEFMARLAQSPRMKQRAFRGYQPSRHDVFVCTYPKSGTYWTMQIAYQIAHRGHGEYEHIHDVVPWPEAPFPGLVKLDDTEASRQAPTGIRVIKTHLESSYVPYSPDARYIVVVRDPKDVCVSSYFFTSAMVPASTMVSPAEWQAMFLSHVFQYGSWVEHLVSYWPWRDRPNVLFLSFGEMKADLPGVARRIAELMGVALTDAEVALVVEKSSFDYMKRIDHKFAPAMPFLLQRRQRPVLMRKGAHHGSGELLTVEQQAEIDRHMREELRRHRCDFPYDELVAPAGKPMLV